MSERIILISGATGQQGGATARATALPGPLAPPAWFLDGDKLVSALNAKTVLQIPTSEIRKNSEDFALMLEWFEAVGYDVDIAENAKQYGVKPTSLKEWAARLKK